MQNLRLLFLLFWIVLGAAAHVSAAESKPPPSCESGLTSDRSDTLPRHLFPQAQLEWSGDALNALLSQQPDSYFSELCTYLKSMPPSPRSSAFAWLSLPLKEQRSVAPEIENCLLEILRADAERFAGTDLQISELSQLLLIAAKFSWTELYAQMVDALIGTPRPSEGIRLELIASLLRGPRRNEIVIALAKRWSEPEARAPKSLSIADFAHLYLTPTMHSQGAPLRVLEPFAVGVAMVKILLRSGQRQSAQDILRELREWFHSMSRHEKMAIRQQAGPEIAFVETY